MAKHGKRAALRWLLLVGAAGAGAYFFFLRGNAASTAVSFRTARVDRGPVEETVTATGSINAVVTVLVGSQVSGTISKLGADFNSVVKEGQVIAQIDATRFKANLDQADAAAKSAVASAARAKVAMLAAKIDRDRAETLAKQGVVGQADLDAARSKYDSAVADMASAEAQVGQARAAAGVARVDLEHTTIRAPISGTVLQRAVDVGQTVAASLQAPTLFTIAQDLQQMEVRASIDEADVGKLHEGQDARFSVDAYPGQDFRATIFQIRSNPTIQQNVVTYDAILRVSNPDGKLRPGMTATVRVVTAHKDSVLRVPNAALRFKPAPELIEGDGKAGPSVPGGAMAAEKDKDASGKGGGGARRAPGGRMGGGGPGGGGPGGGDSGVGKGGGRSGRNQARVYKVAGSKVAGVPFKPGVGDDEYTEVLSGSLADGDEVVVDVIGGPQRSGAAQSPMRGRGPRFF